MTPDWLPAERTKDLQVQVAYDADRIGFRFEWDQPDPGGWLHDMLVFRGGEWHRFTDPSPWVADGDHGHTGFYEDRISFFLDDGSVRGFQEFGGWLTVHEGMRSMPSQVPEREVRAHHHYGDDGLGRTDVRKYIPQACAGEWWENDWRAVRPQEELNTLKAEGVFLDLPMWRAHRSDPLDYGTDHHVLDYRHSDQGQNTYTNQDWGPEDGPAYMWDPAVVDGGALDYERVREGEFPEQGEDIYALEREDAVPFDPDVAAREGAMIPRRVLQQPHGSAADWTATGDRDGDTWTVEMWRELRTGHPADTTQLQPGGVYDWSPAVHHGAGQRWHWVAYPYKLGLGVEPTYPSDAVDGEATVVAERFAGDRPDWGAVEPTTIPLVFPGVQSWSDLTDDDHPRAEAIRNTEITMWDLQKPAAFPE
jgi:hypothetical protein